MPEKTSIAARKKYGLEIDDRLLLPKSERDKIYEQVYHDVSLEYERARKIQTRKSRRKAVAVQV